MGKTVPCFFIRLLDRDLAWLRETPNRDKTQDPGTGAEYTWHIIVNAVFAVGEVKYTGVGSGVVTRCVNSQHHDSVLMSQVNA